MLYLNGLVRNGINIGVKRGTAVALLAAKYRSPIFAATRYQSNKVEDKLAGVFTEEQLKEA